MTKPVCAAALRGRGRPSPRRAAGTSVSRPPRFRPADCRDPPPSSSRVARQLSTLFKGVARVHASLAQEMVQATLARTVENLSAVPWNHLEVRLCMRVGVRAHTRACAQG